MAHERAGNIVMLERCVGIKLAKGMQRTPGSFMIPNIKRMNVGIRNITSTYSSHWQAETELDYDLDRAISDLFDVEAPRFWGRSEERWEYLADAQHDPLGGVYLRNLYWPEDADSLLAIFVDLVVMKCRYRVRNDQNRAARMLTYQAATFSAVDVDDALGSHNIEPSLQSEDQPSTETCIDPTMLDPSIGCAFPPPVAPMLSHEAWRQTAEEFQRCAQPLVASRLSSMGAASRASPGHNPQTANTEPQGSLNTTDTPHALSSADSRADAKLETALQGSQSSAVTQVVRADQEGTPSGKQSELGESGPEQPYATPPEQLEQLTVPEPSSWPEGPAGTKRARSDNITVARAEKAQCTATPSKRVEDLNPKLRELAEEERLVADEERRTAEKWSVIERENQSRLERNERQKRTSEEAGAKVEQRRKQRIQQRKDKVNKMKEELEKFRETMETLDGEFEAEREKEKLYEAELQALEEAIDSPGN